MSDEKAKLKVGDEVDVVAIGTGFRNGRLVNPGAQFKATVVKGKDGQPRLPKWVQPASQATVRKTGPVLGDTRPVAAQQAAKQKAAQLSGEQAPGGSSA